MIDRNPERFRREIIEEEFFETREAEAQSKRAKAPLEARKLVNKWKGEERTKKNVQRKRHNSFVDDITESVVVCMGPEVKNGEPGYSVRKEVVYPDIEDK